MAEINVVDINLKVPALEKLLDYCASGVGAIGGPMLARWKARTEADVLRIKAQGQADAIRLITDAQAEARQSFEVVPSSIQGEIDVRNEIQARLSFQEEKRQGNIEAVVGMAVAEVFLRLGGIGALIVENGARFRTAYVIAAIVPLPLLGIALTKAAGRFEQRIQYWRYTAVTE